MGGIDGQTDGLVQALLGRMYYLIRLIYPLFFLDLVLDYVHHTFFE